MIMAVLVQVFPEPVPLPPPEEGPTEPACKLTSRKPTPKKVPTHTRRPYKKRKQAMLLQPGDQAAAGMSAAFHRYPADPSSSVLWVWNTECAHEGLASAASRKHLRASFAARGALLRHQLFPSMHPCTIVRACCHVACTLLLFRNGCLWSRVMQRIFWMLQRA